MLKSLVRSFYCGLLVLCLVDAQTSPPPAQTPDTADVQQLTKNDASPAELDSLVKQFIDVFSTVESESADPQSSDKLIYGGAIPAMLRPLDPHTQFFDPNQFQQLNQMEESEQKGFGSIVSVLAGQVIFLQTLPGTPSNRAGIQAGDELVAINNVAIQSLEPEQITELLTEARQQEVTVYIRRREAPRILAFPLKPELVDTPSVDRAFLLRPGVGYVRVTSWDLQTAKELHDAISKLGDSELSGLVLDLRNNPGGLVKAALEAAALFLQPGQKILTAKGRASEDDTARVPKNATPYKFKLAVLIDGRTASASEILSGALQDHDRAVIVGEPSYGKGLVQSVLPLSNGAGLAITTAFYYTPSGRSIQHPLKDSTLSDTFHESAANAPTYKTDNGRVVTGGGGIQPDVRVSPAALNRVEGVIDATGSLTTFATQYLGEHPGSLTVTPDMMDELKVFLAARSIQPSIAEWSQERSWLSNRLRQELVTQAKGVAQGDEVAAQFDPQVQAALQAMQNNGLLAQARPN